MSAGVSPPRLVAKKEPSYGEASRQARIEGTVVLYVVISPDGKPEDVLVYRHLSPDLDAEAVRTVRQWRFTSGMSNGQPVAVPVLIEVNFQLR
jgi:protein TonB